MNLVFFALWIPETLAERVALTEETLALLPAVDDPLTRYWAAKSGYLNLVQAGRVAEAAPLLESARDLADRMAQPALRWRSLHTEATHLLLLGDPAAAAPFAQEAFEVGSGAGEPEAAVYLKSQTLCLHWQRGTMAELSTRIRGTSPRPPNATASLSLVFVEAGRDEEAAALLDSGVAAAFAELPRDPAFVASAAMYAEGAIRLRHAAAAAALYDLVLPLADQIGFDGVTTVGALEHHLGGLAAVLGRHDEAIVRLQRSAATHDAIGARFFEARSRHELAAALADRGAPGDVDQARAEAGRARSLAKDHAYRSVDRRAHELLASLGGP